MPKPEIEEVADSLATVAYVLHQRLKCWECEPCAPCSPVFMKNLTVLSNAGNVDSAVLQERAAE